MRSALHALAVVSVAAALGTVAPLPVGAQEPADSAARPEPFAIGVAAPLSGPYALLGEQIRAGAREAAARSGGRARIVPADTGCTAEGGAEAAASLTGKQVDIVVGFLCVEALEAALPVLSGAQTPTIVVGVRADRVTDDRARSGALVWRLATRSGAEAPAIARAVAERWPDGAFALVDDGAIDNRALADAIRASLEEAGRPPTSVDTLRPGESGQAALAARLDEAGAERGVFVGARGDAEILARDGGADGSALVLLGGESFLDEEPATGEADGRPDLPDGTLAVAPRRFYPMSDPRAPGTDTEPSRAGYSDIAFAATEIALAALEEKAGATGRGLGAILDESAFPTILGTVAFDEKGDSRLDLFQTFEWQAGRFVPAAEATPPPDEG